jgi:hypothetical protein
VGGALMIESSGLPFEQNEQVLSVGSIILWRNHLKIAKSVLHGNRGHWNLLIVLNLGCLCVIVPVRIVFGAFASWASHNAFLKTIEFKMTAISQKSVPAKNVFQ